MLIAAKVDSHTINKPKPTIWNAFTMQPNTLAKLHVTIPNATMVLYSDISYVISLEKKSMLIVTHFILSTNGSQL